MLEQKKPPLGGFFCGCRKNPMGCVGLEYLAFVGSGWRRVLCLEYCRVIAGVVVGNQGVMVRLEDYAAKLTCYNASYLQQKSS